jgi:hypothetical protein
MLSGIRTVHDIKGMIFRLLRFKNNPDGIVGNYNGIQRHGVGPGRDEAGQHHP